MPVIRERKARNESKRVDRLPPYSEEAELAVLGCVLLDPKGCLAECGAAFAKGGAAVFYDEKHRLIYALAVEMWNAGEAVDVVTLAQRLLDREQLAQVGGTKWLSALQDKVSSAANLKYYTDILREKFLRRSMLGTLTRCETRVWEDQGPVAELLDGIEAAVLEVGNLQSAKTSSSIKELLPKTIDRIEDARRGVGALGGLRTHLGYLDKLTGGLWKGEMAVIGARPSVGKTSLLTTILTNLSLQERCPVGMFSMEMSEEDIAFRVLCAEARVNLHKIRTGFIAEEDYPKLTSAGLRLVKQENALLHIDDTRGLDILEFRARLRRMHQQHGIKAAGVDFLQLMHCSRFPNNRVQEVGAIANGIKEAAGELGIPIVVLSQLNRESAKNRNTKPTMDDLRESGEIEQAADLVGLLYRKPREKDEEEESTTDEVQSVNMNVDKQRNGPTGLVEFTFLRWCMRFEDAYGNRGTLVPAAHTQEETGARGGRMPTNEELGLQ